MGKNRGFSNDERKNAINVSIKDYLIQKFKILAKLPR